MALAVGTNCGFCTVRPTADPNETAYEQNDTLVGLRFTSPAGATLVTEIGWFQANGLGNDAVAYYIGLYEDNGSGLPGSLVAGSSILNGTTGHDDGGAWYYHTGLSWTIVENHTYWMAVGLGALVNDSNRLDWADIAGTRYADASKVGGQLVDPFGSSAGTDGSTAAVYCLYTTGGAPAGPNYIPKKFFRGMESGLWLPV